MLAKRRDFSGTRIFPRLGILRDSGGLTLLELIVAFLILQIALVGFAQFMTKALDYSSRVRRGEMAQILAQVRMEELIRAIPTGAIEIGPVEQEHASRVLNERPGGFDDLAYAHSEDVSPYRWLAAVAPTQGDPKLLGLTLYVYSVRKKTKEEKSSEPVESFVLSEDRERFTYTHTMPDGTVEVVQGRERIRVSSAVALP